MSLSKEILEKQKQERLRETNISSEGYEMKIVEYKDSHDIIIEFQDEYKCRKRSSYKKFKDGNIRNPYRKMFFGVGYIGEGKYKSREKDGKITKAYQTWHNMMKRCYDPYELNRHPTYIDCYVCEEWHSFQNFAQWWEENVYNCNGEQMCLDKDILYKKNNLYSPNTCLIVPERINKLFIKQQRKRGKYPIGVTAVYCRKVLKLYVQCNILKEGKIIREHLGYFPLNRPFQAFYVYKTFKENYIKQIADEYKDLIPKELYNAMYKYEIEIND